MPSTYSPSLRIELIGDGEQSGTWGQTTNNNLGTLIEQAITGITTVNVSAGDVVLTNYNGTADESRSAVLIGTGSPGVIRYITVPNAQKTYLVKNLTNATLGIKTASGVAATVSPNSQSLMVCDGLDGITAYLESVTITPPFPSGTTMLFAQTTAPTGWTKLTSQNDKALRVVSGTAGSGGALGFSTVFANQNVSDTALSVAQMPSHSHGASTSVSISDPGHAHNYNKMQGGSSIASGSGYTFFGDNTGFVGTGISASGSTSISANGSGATHNHSINLNVGYVDVILASKA
jgi:hypothetical protein